MRLRASGVKGVFFLYNFFGGARRGKKQLKACIGRAHIAREQRVERERLSLEADPQTKRRILLCVGCWRETAAELELSRPVGAARHGAQCQKPNISRLLPIPCANANKQQIIKRLARSVHQSTPSKLSLQGCEGVEKNAPLSLDNNKKSII